MNTTVTKELILENMDILSEEDELTMDLIREVLSLTPEERKELLALCGERLF